MPGITHWGVITKSSTDVLTKGVPGNTRWGVITLFSTGILTYCLPGWAEDGLPMGIGTYTGGIGFITDLSFNQSRHVRLLAF